MEQGSGDVFCVLCCLAFPLGKRARNKYLGDMRLKRFLNKGFSVEVEGDEESVEENDFLNVLNTLDSENAVTLCASCADSVFTAFEKRKKADEMEVWVRQLQSQVVIKLKQLQGEMCALFGEMRKIERTIRRSVTRDMENRLNLVESKEVGGKRRSSRNRTNYVKEVVDFRKRILSDIQNLLKYNTNETSDLMNQRHAERVAIKIVRIERPAEVTNNMRADVNFNGQRDDDGETDPDRVTAPIKTEVAEIVENEMDEDYFNYDGDGMDVSPSDPDLQYPEIPKNVIVKSKMNEDKKTDLNPRQGQRYPSRSKRKTKKPPRSGEDAKKKKLKPEPDPVYESSAEEGDSLASDDNDSEFDIEAEMKCEKKKNFVNNFKGGNLATQLSRKDKRLIDEMHPFKSSIVSSLLSCKGDTVSKITNLFYQAKVIQPFKKCRMKYDPVADTIAVEGISVIVVEQERALQCSLCSLKLWNSENKQVLPVESQMHEHILGQHLKTLKCPHCSEVPTSMGALHAHLHLKHDSGLACDICGRTFPKKDKMERHRTVHMNTEERIEIIGKPTLDRQILAKVELIHTKDVVAAIKTVLDNEAMSMWKKKLLIQVIKKEASNSTGSGSECDDDEDVRSARLSLHAKYPLVYDEKEDKLSVSGIQIFFHEAEESECSLECSICGGREQGKLPIFKMQNHIMGAHLQVFVCPNEECKGKNLSNWTNYTMHIKLHEKGSVNCTCDICGRTLSNLASLTEHKFTHMNESEKAEFGGSKKPRPFNFQCTNCGYKCRTSQALKKHERTHLTPEEKEYFICSQCGKRYSSPEHLKKHEKFTCPGNGTEMARFNCTICSRSLKNAQELQKHYLRMHPEMLNPNDTPFQCTFCSARFKTSWSLQAHETKKHTQTAESGFVCRRGCGKVLNTEHGRTIHETMCQAAGLN